MDLALFLKTQVMSVESHIAAVYVSVSRVFFNLVL